MRFYAGNKARTEKEVAQLIRKLNKSFHSDHSRYRHIIEMIPTGKKVLDYGCGWGCTARAIALKGNSVVGIDLSDDSLYLARKYNAHPDVEYLNEPILQFKKESFDVVNSNQVLEHTHNPGNYLKNCNGVLKKGGHLIISVPNVINLDFFAHQLSGRLHSQFKKISKEILADYIKESAHIQSWDPCSFVRLLSSLGFRYVSHRFIEGVMLPFFKSSSSKLPFARYWHTKIPGLRNLSYTMLFKFKKVKFVNIRNTD